MLSKIVRFFLDNRLVAMILLLVFIGWGISTSPFSWNVPLIPSDPVPVDAIPDIGENQQIVFTEWPGRSPHDVEDQITYPLTASLLGIPGVKSIRSTSMFGFASIYIIFDDEVEYYWSRSRILEKLNSLPANILPEGVQPSLGPDATALGQVFWYTLEGRDPEGNPTGGWDLHEIRKVQDFYVKYGLSAVPGVSEVASVGGYVQEYQVDVNPEALKAYGVGIDKVMMAVKNSNRDAGAKTIEINKAEYLVRGLGYIKDVSDLEEAVVVVNNNIPVRIKDLAVVNLGPATRRGALDKEGADVVGGVVVARYGSNPLEVINGVKEKIIEISTGLPSKKLNDGTMSQLTIVPFYDRTKLINETIGTLRSALAHEILITIIVVIVIVMNLRASLLISSLLPVAVLMTFIIMRYAGVDANIVALSGIAIAIGVMVDVGIVIVENILRHLESPENKGKKGQDLSDVIFKAVSEVSGAVTTALATTIISFLPVFAMEAAEGKLFRPLAFTKTFALLSTFVLGIVILPPLVHILFSIRVDRVKVRRFWNVLLIIFGLLLSVFATTLIPLALVVVGVNNLLEGKWPKRFEKLPGYINIVVLLMIAMVFLTKEWMPLGYGTSYVANFLFVAILIGLILSVLLLIIHYYEKILIWCLENKLKFLLLPIVTIMLGVIIWLGFSRSFEVPARMVDVTGFNIRTTSAWSKMTHLFPGIGSEFMPSLDEGSFLLMPTSMPHAGVEENRRVVQQLDMRVSSIPEVQLAVGKMGRVESALDPAPISMYENVINYKPEYIEDSNGHRLTFKVDENGQFILKEGGSISQEEGILVDVSSDDLVIDEDGVYFRNWRSHIQSTDDIWNEIVRVTKIPGVTSAPKLQPIETRLVMLQTGMRAPMGIKVFGHDLKTIEKFGRDLETILKEVPWVKAEAVFADRIVGKPYLQLKIDRNAVARYGLSIEQVQTTIETAIGGMTITTTLEGRERFPVRVRYPRELRDDPDQIKKILVPTSSGVQVPLGELTTLEYERGPQMIKSENTFLVGYVLFDKKDGYAEVDVVNQAKRFIDSKIDNGELIVPHGISYTFSGNYENQVRAANRLAILIPLSLIAIFLLLYFQFRTVIASTIHFSGVFVAFAGGFIMLWLYDQSWFLDFSIAGTNMRDLFNMGTVNLSVAVWVGFVALFGIATDDGVIMGTYIHQVFEERNPKTISEVREAVMIAGKKRVRPALMTAATTLIALIPVLTSTGKGSDIMGPMAIPTFGGMAIQIMTIFVVPVLQSVWREFEIKRQQA